MNIKIPKNPSEYLTSLAEIRKAVDIHGARIVVDSLEQGVCFHRWSEDDAPFVDGNYTTFFNLSYAHDEESTRWCVDIATNRHDDYEIISRYCESRFDSFNLAIMFGVFNRNMIRGLEVTEECLTEKFFSSIPEFKIPYYLNALVGTFGFDRVFDVVKDFKMTKCHSWFFTAVNPKRVNEVIEFYGTTTKDGYSILNTKELFRYHIGRGATVYTVAALFAIRNFTDVNIRKFVEDRLTGIMRPTAALMFFSKDSVLPEERFVKDKDVYSFMKDVSDPEAVFQGIMSYE